MSNNKESIVYIVDDDKEIGNSLTWLLETVNLSTRIYQDAREFLSQFDPSQHGCLVIDIRMPYMNGLVLQEELNAKGNQMPIIFITGHGDVPMAVRAMQAGAMDFILKPFNNQLLLEKIQSAIARDNKRPDILTLKQRFFSLSPREIQILKLITSGKLNKQVANELQISLSTVEAHRSRVMEKMQANSLAELIKMYFMLNLDGGPK